MNNMVLRFIVAAFAVATALGLRAANLVTVSPMAGDAGGEVEVTVSLDNGEAAYAMQLLVDMPEGGCTVVSGSAAAIGRAEGFDASAGIRDGRLSLMLYSLSRQAIAAGSGEMARFRIVLDSKPIDTILAAEAKITDASGNGISCRVERVTLKSLRPQLEITDQKINYGRVALGDKEIRTIGFRNTGTSALTVSDVKFEREEFKIVGNLPATVQPGESAALTVEFTAMERGAFGSTARLVSNSADTYSVVDISAEPYAVNALTIGSASGVCDSEVTVPLSLANMDKVNGLTLEIDLPVQLEYVAGSFALDESRIDGHSFTATCNGRQLKIIVYSLTNAPFKGNSGELGSLRLRLNGKGSYAVQASKAVLSAFYRGQITDVLSDCYNGYVSIQYPSISVGSSLSLGRTAIPTPATNELTINNYGNAPLTVSRIEIDNELLTVDAQLPLEIAPYSSVPVRIVCPGESTGEINGVMNIYSNDPDKRLATVNVEAVRYAENRLTFAGRETPLYVGSAVVEVNLANYTPIRGMQFDVAYPAGMLRPSGTAAAIDRAEGFEIIRREITPGISRYFVYSLGGNEIARGNGRVLTLPFDVLENTPAGTLSLTTSNFVLSSPDMVNMNSELTSAAFNINLIDKLMGDIDYDGKISIFDLTRCLSIRINNEPPNDYLHIIDMNGDGDFSIIDITELISLILETK